MDRWRSPLKRGNPHRDVNEHMRSPRGSAKLRSCLGASETASNRTHRDKLLSVPSAELANQLGTSDRTLRRLVEAGVIRSLRRASGHHPVPIAEEEWLRGHWQVISGLRRALRSEPSVRAALLFGSVAKGTDTPASDIDVVVDLQSDNQMDLRGLRRRLAGKLGRSIDLFLLSDLEAEPERLLQIVSHARPIVDRVGTWQRLSQQRRVLRGRALRRQHALRSRSL